MATSTGTSSKGYQALLTFPASDAWAGIFFNSTVKPAEGKYVGWLRIHRFNTICWAEVNSKPIYGEGLWLPNITATGTHRLSAIWRVNGLIWTAYSGPFA